MQKLNIATPISSIHFIMLFSVISFVFHFVWEYVQCTPFFRHVQNSPVLAAMIFAAAGDVLMICVVYLVTSAEHGSFTWFESHWNSESTVSIIGYSLFFAILVELWAIQTERWTYTKNNPLIPVLGISILPLIQMALINPISMFGSKIILKSLKRAKHNSKETI